MNVVAAYSVLLQILGKLLGHTLGEGGYKHALVALASLLYLLHKVVDLIGAGTYLYYGVEQAGGANNLLYNNSFALLQFVIVGGGADIYHLMGKLPELFEFQGAVVEGCGQAETKLHKVALAGAVATIHCVYLWHAHVTLVDDEQKIVGEEVEQAVGASAGLSSVEVTRVVLYSRAVSKLAQHLGVVGHTLVQAFGLERLANLLEIIDALGKVFLNLNDGAHSALLCCHKEVGRVYLVLLELGYARSCVGVNLLDALNLVVPECYAQDVVAVGEADIYGVALYAKITASQFKVVAHVKAAHKVTQKDIAVE